MVGNPNFVEMRSRNCFSLVLIVSATILVDRIIRRDLISERLLCQVWLWLALALSTSETRAGHDNEGIDGAFQTWLHAVVFCNVVSIFAESRRVANPCSLGNQKEQVLVDSLPHSAWISMMSCWIPIPIPYLNVEEVIPKTCQVFVVSLAVSWVLQWHRHRKARIADRVQGILGSIPSTHDFFPSQRIDLDLSHWFEWHVAQTWTWISNELVADLSYDTQSVLRLLAPHQLNGKALDTLTIQHLVGILNVPYGPAVQLSHAIDTLKQRYPKPQYESTSMETSFSPRVRSEPDWLTLHDQQYYMRPSSHFSSDVSDQRLLSHLDLPAMDPGQEKRLASLMSERYGLHLPTIRTLERHQDESMILKPPVPNTDGQLFTNPSVPTIGESSLLWSDAQRTSHSLKSGDPDSRSQDELIDHSPAVHSQIPSAVFEQMPPKIREIAERRPNLVKQLLILKKQSQETLKTHSMEYSMDIKQERDSDDEMTSLI